MALNVENLKRILRAMEKRGLVKEPHKAYRGTHAGWFSSEDARALVCMLRAEMSIQTGDRSVDEEREMAPRDNREAVGLGKLIILAQELVTPLDDESVKK